MRNWLKVFAAVCFAGYTLLAHADFASDFMQRFPAAKGAKIERAFPGFWSVIHGDEIFFVNDDMSILISGQVVDLKTHRSITDQLRESNRPTIDLSQLDVRDAIKFGSGARKLYVFSDPDCPFCRKLDGELAQLPNVTVYLFPFPLTSLHPNAANIAQAIWCQPDRAQAWAEYQRLVRENAPVSEGGGVANIGGVAGDMNLQDAWQHYLASKHQPAQPTCENPIQRNLALGEKLHIFGTPALIFEDGTMLPGLVPMERLTAELDSAAAKVAKGGK